MSNEKSEIPRILEDNAGRMRSLADHFPNVVRLFDGRSPQDISSPDANSLFVPPKAQGSESWPGLPDAGLLVTHEGCFLLQLTQGSQTMSPAEAGYDYETVVRTTQAMRQAIIQEHQTRKRNDDPHHVTGMAWDGTSSLGELVQDAPQATKKAILGDPARYLSVSAVLLDTDRPQSPATKKIYNTLLLVDHARKPHTISLTLPDQGVRARDFNQPLHDFKEALTAPQRQEDSRLMKEAMADLQAATGMTIQHDGQQARIIDTAGRLVNRRYQVFNPARLVELSPPSYQDLRRAVLSAQEDAIRAVNHQTPKNPDDPTLLLYQQLASLLPENRQEAPNINLLLEINSDINSIYLHDINSVFDQALMIDQATLPPAP